MLGAFFMATDMVTSPVTRRGMLIFGARLRPAHRADPPLGRLSRGRQLRHPAHERGHAADRPRHAAAGLRQRPQALRGEEGGMKETLNLWPAPGPDLRHRRPPAEPGGRHDPRAHPPGHAARAHGGRGRGDAALRQRPRRRPRGPGRRRRRAQLLARLPGRGARRGGLQGPQQDGLLRRDRASCSAWMPRAVSVACASCATPRRRAWAPSTPIPHCSRASTPAMRWRTRTGG